MKRTVVISTVVILGFAGSSQAALMSPVQANASLTRLGFLNSFLDYNDSGAAGNTIDGSGFPGNVDNNFIAQGTIDVAADPKDQPINNWYFNSDQGTLPQQVYYDLGSVKTISSVVIWNNFGSGFGNPISQVDVGTATEITNLATFDIPSLAALTWTDNLSDQVLSTIDGTGQTLTFSSPVTTRYLRVNAELPTNALDGLGYNEFAVNEVVVPGLPGDLNGDGFVGQDDLNIVLGDWGNMPPGDPRADPSGDGFVGQDDLNPVLADWGQGTPPLTLAGGSLSAAAVPEPSSLALAMMAFGMMCRCRKRFDNACQVPTCRQ